MEKGREKEIELKCSEGLLHLLLSAILLNNKNLETDFKSFSIKKVNGYYFIEETRTYKLDKNFLTENKNRLLNEYKNIEKEKFEDLFEKKI